MKLKEIMTPQVETVNSDASLQDVAQKMKALDVGVIPVMDEDRVSGIVTDRDIVIRVIAEGTNPWDARVSDCMTAQVEACFQDDDINKAAELMQRKRIRRLVVLDRDTNRLVGIVSLGDLATVKGGRLTERTLEKISEPSEPRRKVA